MVSGKQIWYNLAKSKLRTPLTRVRHWGLQPNDAFIASYPRSGNTWLRFVLFEILVTGSAGFDEVNHIVPEVGLHKPAYFLLPGEGRLIKTHEPFQKEYRKAIYLVRDVRDVVLSEFAYQKALGWIPDDFDLFLEQFLRGEVNPFNAWHHHVTGWMDSPLARTSNLMLIKFDEMRKNTEQTVIDVLDFLGVEVASQTVRDAIANNTVQRMQEKEHRSPQLASSAPKANAGVESRFIRSGSVGGWRSRLTPQQQERILAQTGEVLARMGYPVSNGDLQAAASGTAEAQAVSPQGR